MSSETEVTKYVSRFIGVSEDKLPSKEELLIDSIASEGVRLSLFQSIDNRSDLTPIHIIQVKNWAIRKSRSLLEYFGVDATSKISEVIDSENRPNMTFLGDIVKLPKGYIVPSLSKYVTIDSEHSLLISGFPTHSLFEIGIPVFVNGISRSMNSETFKEKHKQYFFELDRNDYLDKSDFETDPKIFLEFLISNNEREKWVPNKYETGYLGNTGGYDFLFGRNPIKVGVDEGSLTFWKTEFEHNKIYRLKFETRNSTEFSITIPNYFFKKVCLAMDSLFNYRRKAILSKDHDEVKLSLNFVPPAAEMRLIYALGGIWKTEGHGKISWTFPSRFLDEVRGISNELWIKIEER